jgi:hypothetical protein
LESGAIYCISIILYLALASLNKLVPSPVIGVFRAAIPQIMVHAILDFPKSLADDRL